MKKLNSKQEGTIAAIAALLVLFSAMLDPRISMALAILALLAIAALDFFGK